MMLTDYTPESATPAALGLGYLAVFAACALMVAIARRTTTLVTSEGMRPVPAFVRATLQVLIAGPVHLHRARMAAVAADAAPTAHERALAMQRHPSATGRRHLHAVPNRVA